MKYIYVINRFTLKNKLEKIVKNIEKASKKFKLDYIIEVNNENYSTEDILNKYKNGKYVIVAVGGDGMINRVLNEIINTKNILGFIPCGTGNDLYKTAVKNLDELTKCDVVKINDKYFLNVACFGIDAEVANNTNIIKSKYISKSQRYLASLFNTFFKYENREMRIIVNDEKFEGKFATVAVCNASFYGNGFMIGPNSSLTDGLIDVYVANDINKFEMLKLILKMKKGRHENDSNIKKIVTNKINIITSNKIKCNIDGEILEDNNFELEVISNGITLYYNQKLIKEIIK